MSVINLTQADFKQEVMESDKPVLIDFWAVWCGPCQMMSPIVDEVAEETDDVKFCKVNVDDEPQLAAMFGIQSIPTLALIKNGKMIDVSIGLLTKEELINFINK
ncbi:MAG: thioredoxin [Eubacterium sp.]